MFYHLSLYIARLIEDETTGTGVVQWASYKGFGRHAGGCGVVFLLFLVAFLGNLSTIMANAWIGIWLRSAAINAQVGDTGEGGTERPFLSNFIVCITMFKRESDYLYKPLCSHIKLDRAEFLSKGL